MHSVCREVTFNFKWTTDEIFIGNFFAVTGQDFAHKISQRNSKCEVMKKSNYFFCGAQKIFWKMLETCLNNTDELHTVKISEY